MPFEQRWYDDSERIILITVKRNFNMQDLSELSRHTRERIATKAYLVDIIVDTTKSSFLPMGFLFATMGYVSNPPRNRGLVVFVGANSMLQSILETLVKIVRTQRNQLKTAESIEAAVAYIVEMQQTNGGEAIYHLHL